jgi:predicted adenylyl cyclase CyaB
VLTVVDKTRDIFWLDNVKIHLDQVEGLGCFLEIEAQDTEGTGDEGVLRQQCEALMQKFGVEASDLIQKSYSDLLLAEGKPGE